MNRAAIELLDSIPLTGLAFCGYQDVGAAIPVPLGFILGSAKRGVIHPLWYPGAQLRCVPLGHAVIMVCWAWYAAGISLILLYGSRPQIM
jgi:hypothetical protein